MPDLDLSDLLAPRAQVKIGPDVYNVPTDMNPMLFRRVSRWLLAYRRFLEDESNPEPDEAELFAAAAMLLHVEVAIVERYGVTACIRLLDFLLQRWAERIRETQTSSTPPSASPTRSKARSRSSRSLVHSA